MKYNQCVIWIHFPKFSHISCYEPFGNQFCHAQNSFIICDQNFNEDNSVPNPSKCGEGNTELLLLAYHQAISWPPSWISHLFSQ